MSMKESGNGNNNANGNQHSGKLMSFSRVEARLAKPAVVNEEIRKALRNDKLWWDKIEPRVTKPGIAGRRAFDQAIAVRELLEWDRDHNKGRIAEFGLSEGQLWTHLYSVFHGAGFDTHQGRIVGLLEAQPHDQPSEAAPAI